MSTRTRYDRACLVRAIAQPQEELLKSPKVVRNNGEWYHRITPRFARKHPQYAPFIGMFLVCEMVDRLDQGAVVTETMVICEQIRMDRSLGHVGLKTGFRKSSR